MHKLRVSYRQRGTLGTFRHLVENASRLIKRYNPLDPHSIERCSLVDAFDAEWNVDTGGDIDLAFLEINSPNYLVGKTYQPSSPTALREMISSLAIDYSRFTFVDLGSGKGRALLVASEFPFKAIVGVEFARDLHNIAQANIERFKSRAQRCKRLTSICADVLDFQIPRVPLVFYSYNAFENELLETLLSRIRANVEDCPREAYVILHNFSKPLHASADEFWRTLKMTPWYAVYSGAAVSKAQSIPIDTGSDLDLLSRPLSPKNPTEG